MLDLKLIRETPEIFKTSLARKGSYERQVDELTHLSKERTALIQEAEILKAERNKANLAIQTAKQKGTGGDGIISKMKLVSQKVTDLDKLVGDIDVKIHNLIATIPNPPDESTPDGIPPTGNQVVREWGVTPKFAFVPKDHIELMETRRLASFKRAVKISGAGFALFENEGARLVRALINFMLDLHVSKHGYSEVWPPALVNRASMTGTGQLPKLEDDMYQLKDDGLFLIPTAEVPVTNIYRDEVLTEEELPIKRAAYTPCFRREAGSYGKDTRGLSRVHQFDKVELVKLVHPDRSLEELELLVREAQKVLELLEIPHRVVLLCAKDLSFAAAKCYDIEAYAPGMQRWLEVSSSSAFFDFQARRMNIKFKPKDGTKPRLVHTLNSSGVALARTIICLIENHQRPDGSIQIPEALKPYFSGRETI